MANIKATENEFRSQVIFWLNKFFEQGGYSFQIATSDPSVAGEGNALFPDVQLWLNREAKQGFCGWELKTPITPIDDEKLIENAVEKAKRMGAKYFITWNMRDAVIWQLSGEKDRKAQRIFNYLPLPINSVDDFSIQSQRIILEERTRAILNDLQRLYQDGHLTYLGADDWFFIDRITKAVEELKPFFKMRLLETTAKDINFRKRIDEWAVKQAFFVGDNREEFFEKISAQIVYQLIGRILFFEVLKQFRNELTSINLKGLSEQKANEEIKTKFAQIRAIDYQAIFEEDMPDKVSIPYPAVAVLSGLIDELNKRDFAHLPQEVLGSIFENLIPAQERHFLGQYFTNENLVDFIITFCVRKIDDFVLDPTCGTGTFLIRAYNRFQWHFCQKDHQKLLSQIWGVDIAPFPAELATINLYRQEIAKIGNFPRVLKKDFFLLKSGQAYEFPPNKPFLDDPHRKINEHLPIFDAIIGNPPYIRQEQIDRALPDYTETTILPAVGSDLDQIVKQTDYNEVTTEKEQPVFSGQADIYAFMFVHAAALLKEGGRLGFVTSNSWLGAGYGKELQKFFLQNFKIVAIVESRVEPWFKTAQVNTIFTILEKCQNRKERENNLVKFVSIKKKLADLIPWDMQAEAQNRWHNLDGFVSKIENAGLDFVKFSKTGEMSVEPPEVINDFENENFKIRVVKQSDLQKSAVDLFGAGAWGRYMRAPKVYFDLQEKLRDKLARFDDEEIVKVNFGIKTGINEFFILSPARIKAFGIEQEFLKPFVSSFREIKKLIIEQPKEPKFLFVCNLTKQELRHLGKKGALQYIEWAEKQKTTGRGAVGKQGVTWSQVPSVRNRPLWYALGEHIVGDLVLNRFIGERIFFPLNPEKMFIGDSMFEASFTDRKLIPFWAALMNSAIFYLFAEIAGRTEAGGGVLRLYGPEIKSLLLPDARKISKDEQKKILVAFDKILARPILKIQDEVKQKDRRKFDVLVLEALGLNPADYLDEIYNSLTDLVSTRVRLGKMQVIETKKRKKQDIAKIKEDVLKETLPAGLLPFPESFVKSGARQKEIAVLNGKLKLGAYFLGKQEVVNDKAEKMECKTVNEAEFIVFSQKANQHIVKIPKEPNEIHNAVVKYRKYIKEIREKLIRALVLRVGDESLAESLAAEILEELGVLH